jgi:hypothetical protein
MANRSINIYRYELSVADPGSGAFLPPGSGMRIRDEFFPNPGSKGYVFW